jgi:hypothetical protein
MQRVGARLFRPLLTKAAPNLIAVNIQFNAQVVFHVSKVGYAPNHVIPRAILNKNKDLNFFRLVF